MFVDTRTIIIIISIIVMLGYSRQVPVDCVPSHVCTRESRLINCQTARASLPVPCYTELSLRSNYTPGPAVPNDRDATPETGETKRNNYIFLGTISLKKKKTKKKQRKKTVKGLDARVPLLWMMQWTETDGENTSGMVTDRGYGVAKRSEQGCSRSWA